MKGHGPRLGNVPLVRARVSTIYEDKNQYRVVLEYGPDCCRSRGPGKGASAGHGGLVPC